MSQWCTEDGIQGQGTKRNMIGEVMRSQVETAPAAMTQVFCLCGFMTEEEFEDGEQSSYYDP